MDEDWKTTTGYHPTGVWTAAKKAARDFLEDIAKAGKTTDYSDVVLSFRSILRKEPNDALFHTMLGQISVEEHAAGRPLLSCLCLYRETWSIGGGFYEMAEGEGYPVDDKLKFWVEEMNRTHAYWKGK